MNLQWTQTGPGRQVLRDLDFVSPYGTRKLTSRSAFHPHISSALPRNCAFHKGKFTENGKPIIQTRSELEHIESKSNGRYLFNKPDRSPGIDDVD